MFEYQENPLVISPVTTVAVVLIEPRIPQNAGNIGRLCRCVGAPLLLVGDMGFRWGDKRFNRSAMDYLEGLTVHHYRSFSALLEEYAGWTPIYVETGAQQSHTQITYPEKTLLVFGSETQGLPTHIVEEYPKHSVSIPMVADARSLNVSNAVAVVLYEVIRQHCKA